MASSPNIFNHIRNASHWFVNYLMWCHSGIENWMNLIAMITSALIWFRDQEENEAKIINVSEDVFLW